MTENGSTLVFFVNGKKIVDGEVDPELTLLQYLRNKLRLCGTKLGCGEGGCGACTVMVSKYDRARNKVIHIPVNSCLAPVCSMHGLAVTTVEGIGSTKTKLHPVQERIAKAHGSQCGFCTPGIVMSMYSLLRSKPKPSMEDLETTLQGNLCRCTGYRAIIEGYRTFTEAGPVSNGCPMGDKCCKVNGGGKGEQEEEELFDSREFLPYDPSQEAIFPPELKVSDALDRQSLHFKGPNVQWFRPLRLAELLDLKDKHPDAKIVVGNSEVGVEVKFRHFDYPVRVSPTHIPEMTGWKLDGDHVTFGASITLQEMQNVLQDLINTETKRGTAVFKAIVDMLHWFAGKQIRSVASVGGNIMTGSPISDLNPIFMASQVRLHLESLGGGRRSVVMDHGFFTGYRKNIVGAKEVLVAISVPFTEPSQHFHAYKQARRRDDDIAIVNSAMNVTFAPNTTVIKDIKLAFGGMAATTVMPLKTQEKLVGMEWNRKTLEQCYAYLLEDLPLDPSAPGGMVSYRQTLALSFFFRAFLNVATKLGIDLDRREMSAVEGFHYVPPKSSQYFQVVPETQERTDSVGRPLVHVSAFKQAAGEAIYCDDIPRFENELYMAFVYSTEAHAEIISVDATEALRSDRVHGFLSAEDLSPEQNSVGPVFHDEEVFVSKTVTSRGQIIAAILAEDQESAQRAARKVKVAYKRLQPVIVTIDDAIEHKSFYPKSLKKIENGDVDRALREADHVLEGDCRTGYQEHFYFETHSVLVNPKKEDNELDIYSSTQHPSEINSLVAHVLQIPQNRISTKVKRLGGGFGGKESRGAVIAVPAAIAASKYNRPVRIMLDRDEDMAMSGGRHPFLLKYKVGFDKEGKISAADVHIYNNAGYSHDLSIAVLERALFHVENAYKIPHVRVSGYCCKTNLPSNTAFRGFGGPQGMFAAETMVRHIADFLGKDELEVSELNLYKEGDVTHYNQTLTYCTLQRCWRECLDGSDYERRKADIAYYNRENRWKKRGISAVPTKFGIAFTIPTLNQAGALILIYQDGSVLLTHGGTEMGQGLHTKMIQVASRTLGIPPEKIHITETATDKVPNTSATAASAGSDLNGMAVLNACKTINERLEPIKKKLPKGTWEEWIKAAYMERISLSATGFYKTPDIGYSFETNTGMAFNYYTYGAAVSEVEIDCLTGDHRVLRTDIVMDLGESLNPAIDIGQVEGGFMQGYGLFVMEEMMYSPTGVIFTKGPGAYKIPGFGDIPIEFNVSLLKGAPNPRAVYSSKAVGEPPLFLASSVLFAIKDAIKAARKDAGISGYFKLDAPATAAKIRMNCVDNLTDMIKEPIPGTYTPWNVIP